MNINVVFVDDNSEFLKSQLRDLGKISQKMETYLRDNVPPVIINAKLDNQGNLQAIEFGNDTIYFSNYVIEINRSSTNDYAKYTAQIIENINKLSKQLPDRSIAIPILDLCLIDNSKDEYPKAEIERINDNYKKMLIVTSWGKCYDRNNKGGKYLETGIMFVQRVMTHQSELEWIAASSKQYEFKDEIRSVKNDSLRKTIEFLADSNSLNLRYFATILLVSGLVEIDK